jgi:rod shape determining protein RodA
MRTIDHPLEGNFRENLAALDKTLLCGVLALVLCGLASIFSAAGGSERDGGALALRQFVWLGVSLGAYFFVFAVGYRKLLEYAYPLYFFSIILLLATIVAAPAVKGAQRTLSLGFVSFQPSEFGKIALILTLAKFLSRYPPHTWKPFAAGLLVGMPALFIVLKQPDLGSALVYMAIILTLLFVAGAPWRCLFSVMGVGVAACPFLWSFLKDYQKLRLLVFLDPTRDPLGAGYNVIQSRIAVGSGSFWGKGFLQGLQSKLRFLPEPHTDFIFSVYAEEFGFWGATLLLFVFGLVFTRMILVGMKTHEIRGKILVAGITAWIWFQMFESIGMSMGLMPVTGLTLPFLSYGGSSLLSNFIALALISGVALDSTKPYK